MPAELQGLGSGLRRREVDEAIAGVTATMSSETCEGGDWLRRHLPRELVADHFDADLLTHLKPEVADKVLVDPGLKLTHPTPPDQ